MSDLLFHTLRFFISRPLHQLLRRKRRMMCACLFVRMCLHVYMYIYECMYIYSVYLVYKYISASITHAASRQHRRRRRRRRLSTQNAYDAHATRVRRLRNNAPYQSIYYVYKCVCVYALMPPCLRAPACAVFMRVHKYVCCMDMRKRRTDNKVRQRRHHHHHLHQQCKQYMLVHVQNARTERPAKKQPSRISMRQYKTSIAYQTYTAAVKKYSSIQCIVGPPTTMSTASKTPTTDYLV